jgi:hypothetical protein
LLNLAQQIDKGIRKKLKRIESSHAKKWREIHSKFGWFRYLCLFVYIIGTQFEKPHWCLQNDAKQAAGDKDFEDWIPDTCNNAEGTYTNSNIPKLNPDISHVIEVFCLIVMLGFSWIRNQYRDSDASSRQAWKY